MPSTYTTNLGIEKIATGEQSGTWGTTTNTNLDLIDEAVNGVEQVTLAAAGSSGSPNDLPISNGSSSDGRNKFIEFIDGGDLGGTAYVQLTPNDAEKVVHIRNSLSAARNIIIFQGTYNASNDFEIPNGADVVLKFDGAGAGAVVSDVYVNLTPTKLTTANLVATSADINGGSVDGATLGTNSAITEAQIDNINIDGNAITSTDTNGNIALTPDGTGEVDISKVDIDGGTIDSTTIGGSTPAAGSFTTFTSNGIDDNADATAITIDSDEKVLIGGTASKSIGEAEGSLQISGTSFANATATLTRYFNNTGSPSLGFGKTRSGTIGTVGTIVADGDDLGAITFAGDDGVDLETRAARIYAEVDGTPGANDMPGALVFQTTADGASSPTERMRISQNGYVGIGTGGNDPQAPLFVVGDLNYVSALNANGTITLSSDDTGNNGFDGAPSIVFEAPYNTGSIRVPYAIIEGRKETTGGGITSGFLAFSTAAVSSGGTTEAMRIDSSQRVLIGGTSSVGISGYGNYLQLQGTTGSDAGISVQRYNDGTGAPVFNFGKTRSTTVGTVGTVVQDGDALGYIIWSGDDGTDVNSNAAYIVSEVDATPGSNDMPGRIVFETTADGNSTPTERMRIDRSGRIGINSTDPASTGVDTGQTQLHLVAPNSNFGPALTVVSDSSGRAYYLTDPSGTYKSNWTVNTSTGTSQIGSVSTHDFAFRTASTEAMRIDTSQRVLIGENTSVPVASNDSALYVGGVTTSKSQIGIARYANSPSAPVLALAKSRSSANGSVGTVVQEDDFLGFIYFAGDDGTDLATRGALIVGEVDGTPGSNDMPGRIVFETTSDGASSPTERMRIDSDGFVSINTTSTPLGRLHVNGVSENFAGGKACLYLSDADGTVESANHLIVADFTGDGNCSGGRFLSCRDFQGEIGSITAAASGTGVLFNTSSDYRLKENVVYLTGATDRLKQLNPCRFNFIRNPDMTIDGFLAHEVQDVIPNAITGDKDEIDANGNPKYQQIDLGKLVPLLTAALQEAIAKIETLEARVATLEAN